MRLKDALKHSGRPFEIPGATRDNLPQFFVKMGYKIGAEIGVEKGNFSEKLCRLGLQIYSIDPWVNSKDYKTAIKVLSPYPKCKMIKKTSMEAVGNFSDSSLDFVYIDGNHEFRYIAEDLVEWTKKVKRGGCVSGDDYFFAKPNKGKQLWHVGFVLHAFVAAYGIPSWYVLGRKRAGPHEKRDRWRSWMFIKP